MALEAARERLKQAEGDAAAAAKAVRLRARVVDLEAQADALRTAQAREAARPYKTLHM